MVGETEPKEEYSESKDKAKGRIEGCVVLTWGCKKSWSGSHTQMYHTQLIVKGNCSKEITTDNKNEPHTRFLRRYWHVLTDRIVGEPPAFRGKPRFCEKDTVKRRNENERWKKTADEWWTLEVKNSSSTQASSRHGVLPFGWGRCSSNTTANWLGTATGNCPTLSTCLPVKNSPDPSLHLKGPTGSPDHHRGIHMYHIRRCGPFLLLLSLISYSKLASWYHFLFSWIYLSFRIYSRRVSHQGSPDPFQSVLKVVHKASRPSPSPSDRISRKCSFTPQPHKENSPGILAIRGSCVMFRIRFVRKSLDCVHGVSGSSFLLWVCCFNDSHRPTLHSFLNVSFA